MWDSSLRPLPRRAFVAVYTGYGSHSRRLKRKAVTALWALLDGFHLSGPWCLEPDGQY